MNDLRLVTFKACFMRVFERCVLYTIYTHFDLPGATICLMVIDFTSAFNTIQRHLLCNKLLNINLCPSLITWNMNYLTLRLQYVSLRPSIIIRCDYYLYWDTLRYSLIPFPFFITYIQLQSNTLECRELAQIDTRGLFHAIPIKFYNQDFDGIIT